MNSAIIMNNIPTIFKNLQNPGTDVEHGITRLSRITASAWFLFFVKKYQISTSSPGFRLFDSDVYVSVLAVISFPSCKKET